MTNFKINFITLIFGIFLALIITELFLQVYNPFPAVVKGNKLTLRTNYKGVFINKTNPKFPSEIFYSGNSLGFRGPNLPDKRVFKIFTIGGSTTHSLYLPDNATWTYLLSKNLEKLYENIWLNNAGFSGQSTYGHTILLSDIIVPLKPEMVIFLFGINDVEHDGGQRLFQFQAGGFSQKLLENSEVVGLSLNLFRLYQAKKKNLTNELDFDLKKRKHIKISDEDYVNKLTDQSTYLQGFKDRLIGLINMSRDNNILPVFLTQPLLVGNQVDPTTGIDLSTIEYNKNISGKLMWEVMELYNSVTKEVGVDNNVHVIDLANSLKKDSKYFIDFMHFTPEGAKKIAEIITVPLREIMSANTHAKASVLAVKIKP